MCLQDVFLRGTTDAKLNRLFRNGLRLPRAMALCLCVGIALVLTPALQAQDAPYSDDPCLDSPSSPLKPGEEAWVTIRVVLRDPGVKIDEAYELLKKKAKNEALRCALGERIGSISEYWKGETSQELFSSFTQIIQSEVSGYVLDVRDVSYDGYFEKQPLLPLYICTLKAKVRCDEKQRDPQFKVAVSLNKTSNRYFAGDEMIVKVRPTKDCYITVFNVMADGRVRVLYPNELMPQRKIAGGTLVEIPSVDERKNMGIHLKLNVRPERHRELEQLLVVATKEPEGFVSADLCSDEPDIIPHLQAAMEDIFSWILKIKPSARASASVSYEILSD